MDCSRNYIFLNLIIAYLLHPTIGATPCQLARNCQECMGRGPTCSWCFDSEYDDTAEGPGYRCDERNILLERNCPAGKIESQNSTIVDAGVQGGDAQLMPPRQKVSVRPHDSFKIDFTFQSKTDYPVDIYFLVDQSYTMRDDLETVSRLTKDIANSFTVVTKDLRMGFGAFVDKPVFPFIVPTPEAQVNPCLYGVGNQDLQCDPPFLYKHILSLTSDFAEFEQKTILSRPSGNLDSPEGGLDALLQVARCPEYIGWRKNARKIVLFATDGGFHLAGDGRLAGLIKPPPKTCQLTYELDRFNKSLVYLGWHNSVETDYPSVGEVAEVLTERDISVIFAIDAKVFPLYEKLAAFLPSAAVGTLTDSSTNIVNLLRENYDKIANRAELILSYDTDSLEVEILAKCQGETEFTKKTVCKEHPVGGKIEYRVSVTPTRCFSGKKEVILKMVALEEQAMLEVTSACHCPACGTPTASYPTSPRCQYHGYLLCGACVCAPQYSGEFCECSAESSQQEEIMLQQCTRPGDDVPCSDRGRCVCGRCKCNLARYMGLYCECDRHGCKRAFDDNQVCGGPQRGECQCDGTCKCKPGYTGERCDCIDSNANCYDPNNPDGPACSGMGVCDCGQCFCNSGRTGQLCNEVQGGESALCTDRGVEQCVLCLRREMLGTDEVRIAEEAEKRPPTAPPVTVSPETVAACHTVCNTTVIDTTKVQIIDEVGEESKDVGEGGGTGGGSGGGSNLCIIYTEDSCRVMFKYRYSDAVYIHRKVDLKIVRKSECTKTTGILYIILGVIAGIVLGGLILLLIYKLVITIDDRRELAKFKMHNENVHWEMAENPIFEPPTTRVMNPTFNDDAALDPTLPVLVLALFSSACDNHPRPRSPPLSNISCDSTQSHTSLAYVDLCTNSF
ncbi:Integrin beta-7 [Echinococcus granulosus]|nr:Integrin beta-7 [Echinococcus granulosus]